MKKKQKIKKKSIFKIKNQVFKNKKGNQKISLNIKKKKIENTIIIKLLDKDQFLKLSNIFNKI